MVNLHQLIYALSDALDLVGVDDVNHGKRVAYMALECAKEVQDHDIDEIKLLHAALLHDCGVSSTRIHDNLVYMLDWEGARDHCIKGYQLLKFSPELNDLAKIVLYHHTHYNVLKRIRIDKETSLLANLIFLTDRVDALTAQYRQENPDAMLESLAKNVREEIASLSDTFFMPQLVDAFLKASEKEVFWSTLDEHNLHLYLSHVIGGLKERTVDMVALADISKLFGHIVDAKSHYTASHSMDVAKLSSFIAGNMGMDEDMRLKIEIAGLLHDLGKLRIPDELLDKNGPLSDDEFKTIEIHAHTTHQILSQVNGMEDISEWASQHHEKLNGIGYPFHIRREQISLPARIIAVADVFQALAQKRPYRDHVEPLEILDILQQKAHMGELDRNAVDIVKNNLQECWEISLMNSD